MHEFLAAAGVQGAFRDQDPAGWEQTLAALEYIPVNYSSAWIDYQLAFQRGHGGQWLDASLVLHHDHRPCGVWPITYSIKGDTPSLTSQGLPLSPPLFVKDLPERSRKRQVQSCLRAWAGVYESHSDSQFRSAESFIDEAGRGMSEWHDQCLRQGAQAILRHELFVDLSLEIEAIKANLRKSYRSLITSGTRAWEVGEMTAEDPALWAEFRELHLQVSGRATRCSESWDLQHRAIAEGAAFLVYLRDSGRRMVGGGFFAITRDEGVYGVGAYDRSLFDKPLGHVVQYRAIELMKSRKLRWYKIGQRHYPSEQPVASDKEISISEFKQGFATHLFPHFILFHEHKPA
jgi:FemAB family protein